MIDLKTYKPVHYEDLVERIWFLTVGREKVSTVIPPDQYINIVFPLDSSYWALNKEIINVTQIEGITLQSSLAEYPTGCKVVGIRLYPYGLASFMDNHTRLGKNKSVPLTSLVNQSVFDQVATVCKGTDHDIIIKNIFSLLQQLFIKKNYEKTKLLRDFYKYFRLNNHQGSIEEFCLKYNTNYSTLNRKFSKTVGITTKQFERLIKFRKSLCDLTDKNESLTNIGLDSGYFDQSHFIREFKLFMNISPSTYNSLIKKADKESKIINYNFNFY